LAPVQGAPTAALLPLLPLPLLHRCRLTA
jgi:hypothetical protein